MRDACKIVMCRGAIAKGVKEEKTIDTEIDGYTLHAGVGYGYLRAQYESVFGKTYESRLISSTNAAPELKYFEVKNDEDIVIL